VPSAATTDAEFVGQGAESLELVRNLEDMAATGTDA
jgi:hypothetical protein